MANQLLILEMSINEKIKFNNEKQYEPNNLLFRTNDHIFMSQFNVTSMFEKVKDIILGSTWIETPSTFILNIKKRKSAFSYKKMT